MGYYVRYDDKELRYVGLNNLHPLYSAYGDTAEEAMTAIIALVRGLDLDNETTDVDLIDPFEDTDEQKPVTADINITDVFWPPWKDLP